MLKSARDSAKLAAEAQHGLISQVLKDVLFSSRPGQGKADTLEPMQDGTEGDSKGAEALGNIVASAVGVSKVASESARTPANDNVGSLGEDLSGTETGAAAQAESGPSDGDTPMALS